MPAFHRTTFFNYQYLSAPKTLQGAVCRPHMQGKQPPAQGPLLTLEPELAFWHLLLLIHSPVETGKARSP